MYALMCARKVDKEYLFVYSSHLHTKPVCKRQRKKTEILHRYQELKLSVPYPSVFEIEDATCPDPITYNRIKGRSGVVAVPAYWKLGLKRMFPREYAKPKYQVPASIVRTGIPELRSLMKEREAGMSLRERVKEKLYPKLGKSSVNQRLLYDAFFNEEIDIRTTRYGCVFDPRSDYFVHMYTPGKISQELMDALGIDDKTPPPWLLAMQRNGMPPSYPDALIPGLNSPIPNGCVYGYQPKGWGEPLYKLEASDTRNEVEYVYDANNQYTNLAYVEYLEERTKLDKSIQIQPNTCLNNEASKVVFDMPEHRVRKNIMNNEINEEDITSAKQPNTNEEDVDAIQVNQPNINKQGIIQVNQPNTNEKGIISVKQSDNPKDVTDESIVQEQIKDIEQQQHTDTKKNSKNKKLYKNIRF
ncbi:hypothetical protein CWI42_121380 [Ordospora colligata]|nr:hypothetical protein CWI42_121380 [Ordospora colligata]